MSQNINILALDVGDARIGAAIAGSIAKLPSPLGIIANDQDVLENLKTLIEEHKADLIIIGLPRNMQGEETQQSGQSRDFAEQLADITDVNIVFADESLSSQRARQHSPDRKYVDDIAACFILEEYLGQYNK